MFFVLHHFLTKSVSRGNLLVVDPDGTEHRFGDGRGKEIRVRLHDHTVGLALALRPDPAFGEAYVDGRLTVEAGSLYELMALVIPQLDYGFAYKWRTGAALKQMLRRAVRSNGIAGARRNVAHHYDLSGKFYDLFLDSDRQYSCAYFPDPQTSLHQAQLAKKRRIAAKLNIEPGMHVLDIGCGWGGLALYLAEVCGAKVTGITLSVEQAEVARRRILTRGLEDQVEICLVDYRKMEGRFDRIASVGMFEHVGPRHFGTYFSKVLDLLSDDGVALIHTIARPHGPYPTSTWVDRYIFPGGYLPALSEVQREIEDSGLYLCDVEVLRGHYARTLRHWRNRFNSNRKKAAEIYDERFCRIWDFYLAGSEIAFRLEYANVLQLQMARHQSALPETRRYMRENEERQQGLDSRSCRPKSVRVR